MTPVEHSGSLMLSGFAALHAAALHTDTSAATIVTAVTSSVPTAMLATAVCGPVLDVQEPVTVTIEPSKDDPQIGAVNTPAFVT